MVIIPSRPPTPPPPPPPSPYPPLAHSPARQICATAYLQPGAVAQPERASRRSAASAGVAAARPRCEQALEPRKRSAAGRCKCLRLRSPRPFAGLKPDSPATYPQAGQHHVGRLARWSCCPGRRRAGGEERAGSGSCWPELEPAAGRPKGRTGCAFIPEKRACRTGLCVTWHQCTALHAGRSACSEQCVLQFSPAALQCVSRTLGAQSAWGCACGPRVGAAIRVRRVRRMGAGQHLRASAGWPQLRLLACAYTDAHAGWVGTVARVACCPTRTRHAGPHHARRAPGLFMYRPSAGCCVPPKGSECGATSVYRTCCRPRNNRCARPHTAECRQM